MQQEIEYIECIVCKKPMPLLRKTKFGYDFCVNCSNVAPKLGIIRQFGPGEDTWDELILNENTSNNFITSYTDVNSLEEE